MDAKYSNRNLPGKVGYDQARAYYEEIFADDDLNSLDTLLTYGFGRVQPEVLALIRQEGKDTQVGITTNPHLVRLIVNALAVDLNGVPIEKLQGIAWG